MSNQAQNSTKSVGIIAAGIGFVVFLILLVIGNFSFFGALFLALLVGIAVAFYLSRRSNDPASAPDATLAKSTEPASAPAASAAASSDPAPAPKPAPAPSAATEPETDVEAPDLDFDGDGVIEGTNEGTRPATLGGPRDGKADDLKKIKGVGPKLEVLLNRLGFYHFDQVASWTSDEAAWVDANLEGFKGRVGRDDWVSQAKLLASGGATEFSKRVDGGDVY